MTRLSTRPRHRRRRQPLQGRARAAHGPIVVAPGAVPSRQRTSRGRPACDARLPRLSRTRREGEALAKAQPAKKGKARPSPARSLRRGGTPAAERTAPGRSAPPRRRRGARRRARRRPTAPRRRPAAEPRRPRPRRPSPGPPSASPPSRSPRSSARSRSPSSSSRTATSWASTTPRRPSSPRSRKPSTTRSTPARRPASSPSSRSRSTTSPWRPATQDAELTKGEGRFVVVVQDNGPGIVKQQVPKIFGKLLYGRKFHRLKQSLTADQAGAHRAGRSASSGCPSGSSSTACSRRARR